MNPEMVHSDPLMPEWLKKRALLSPNRLALVHGSIRLSFMELELWASSEAKRLARLGVRYGDRVAVLSPNTLGFALAILALPKIGATLVPLNTRLAGPELSWQIRDVGARFLLYDGYFEDKAFSLASEVLGLQAQPLLEGLEGRPEAFERVDPESLRASQVHSILYTSGTTGQPKGAMLTFGNYLFSALGSCLNLGLNEEDGWLLSLPLFHVGGLSILLRGIILGIPTIVPERLDPEAINRAIDGERVTLASLVAVTLERTLKSRGERPFPKKFRGILLGGGPIPSSLLESAASIGVGVYPTYGLTEAASQVSTLSKGDTLRKRGSAGKPLFFSEVCIRDAQGRPKPPMNEGEILVRGPILMTGYYGRPKESALALEGGWLHTGDIGFLDAEGYLYVLDRRTDMIVSGGENVYPAEVESALLSHPLMMEAGVVGVPDPSWGQVPVAFVVLKEGFKLDEGDLKAFLRARLAGYKVPARIYFWDRLPRGASGKLLRGRLREAWLKNEPL